jgi:hypothetical protein
MSLPILPAFWALVAINSTAAFEVEATIRKVDTEKRIISFTVAQGDRTARVAQDAPVRDAEGKELPEGLGAPGLKEGAVVTLTIERDGDKPVIRAVRLGRRSAGAGRPKEVEGVDTSGLVPLTDLGAGKYRGFQGGLYPDSSNARPAAHEEAGRALAKTVRPLDADGTPSPDGKVVLLGVGFSNTVQAFQGFMQAASKDGEVNPRLVPVNGAVGGMSAAMIRDPDRGRGETYWQTVDERLKAAGVTRQQVQAAWVKETNPATQQEDGFPRSIRDLEEQLGDIVRILHRRFPNLKLVYLSSRTYGGWAKRRPDGTPPGNSEPFSYESGFAVKWLIGQQLAGEPALNFDPGRGPVRAPWLSWGPYLWANGTTPRRDGFRFELDDFREDDRMHESPAGQRKVGGLLLHFFKTDPTAAGWFRRDSAGGDVLPKP